MRFSGPLAVSIVACLGPAPASPVRAELRSERAVRIFFDEAGKHWSTGDVVSKRQLHTILFLNEKCSLPVAGAASMRRAWVMYGAYQLGCWYPTVGGAYVFVGRIPELTHATDAYWEGHPRAVLNPDGSATITEQNYDSETFSLNVMTRKTMEWAERLHEKP